MPNRSFVLCFKSLYAVLSEVTQNYSTGRKVSPWSVAVAFIFFLTHLAKMGPWFPLLVWRFKMNHNKTSPSLLMDQ
jgi:hypothetical protein